MYIDPQVYVDLVKLTRQELDARGLTDIGIVGPGASAIQVSVFMTITLVVFHQVEHNYIYICLCSY